MSVESAPRATLETRSSIPRAGLHKNLWTYYDSRLETRVIWLIGAEIALSIIFGIYAGIKQSNFLDHMDASAAATAEAMKAARDSRKTLAADQERSLDRLREMDASGLTLEMSRQR